MAAAKCPELKDKTAQPGSIGEDVMMRDAAAPLPPTANVAEPSTKVLVWRASLRARPCACWPCACVSVMAPIHCVHSLLHGVHSRPCDCLSLVPPIHALKSVSRAPTRSRSFPLHAHVLSRVLAWGCVGAGARGVWNRGIPGCPCAGDGADGRRRRRQVSAPAAHPTPYLAILGRGARSLAY